MAMNVSSVACCTWLLAHDNCKLCSVERVVCDRMCVSMINLLFCCVLHPGITDTVS